MAAPRRRFTLPGRRGIVRALTATFFALGTMGVPSRITAAVETAGPSAALPASALDGGPPAGAVDVTEQFEAFLVDGRLDDRAADRAFANVRERLRGVRVIIVPSYLVDLIRPAMAVGLVDYFSDQRRWLRSIGIGSVIAPLDTEASIATNGRALADIIEKSDTPVCMVSHSKGGLDTLVALSILPAETLARVRCWLALQAPFAGSPLADRAAALWLLRPAVDLALYLVGGSPRSLDDLTTALRRQYLADRDDAVRRVASHVPTLAVATVLHPSTGLWPASHFEPTRNLIAEDGIENDGVVPTPSAILPHARFVVIDGLDHGDTVDVDCWPACPVENDVTLLKALLAITLAAPDESVPEAPAIVPPSQ